MPDDIVPPSPPSPPDDNLSISLDRIRRVPNDYSFNVGPLPIAADSLLSGRWTIRLDLATTSPPQEEGIPVEVPPVEEEDDDEDEDPPTCSVCEEPEDDCRCYHCGGCDTDVDSGDASQCENCEQCSRCCECHYCEGCERSRNSDGYCTSCDRCEGCCSCFYCEGCSENCNTEGQCGNCDNCDSCCECQRCASCGDVHRGGNTDYHCGICDRGAYDTCGCCPGYDDNEEHRYFENVGRTNPAATIGATCPKCETTIGYGGWSSRCSYCKNCKKCCVSDDSQCHAANREDQLILFKDREMRWHDNTAKNSFLKSKVISWKTEKVRMDPANRHISVELEIDNPTNRGRGRGRRLHEALEKWGDSVVQDGSVDGWEINATPSSGEAFLSHIRDLADGMEDMNFHTTESCGMHVHVNTKDMGFQDLRRLVKLYTKVEKALFDTCAPYRLHGQYSVPCGKWFTTQMSSRNPKDFKGDIHSMLYGFAKKKRKASELDQHPEQELVSAYNYIANGSSYRENQWTGYIDIALKAFSELHRSGLSKTEQFAKVREILRGAFKEEVPADVKSLTSSKSNKRLGSLRYKALNLHSHFYRGSVEFRHHEGTADYNVITGFGRLCAEIVSKAVAVSDAQLDALPKNSRKAMLAILPPDLTAFVIGEWTKNDAILKGSLLLRQNRDQRWLSPDQY